MSREKTPHFDPTKKSNNMSQTTNLQEIFKYLHAKAVRPAQPNWISAIRKGYFQSYPGLIEYAVQKHLPNIKATSMGHPYQNSKNKISTQSTLDTAAEK